MSHPVSGGTCQVSRRGEKLSVAMQNHRHDSPALCICIVNERTCIGCWPLCSGDHVQLCVSLD